jgi:hypothetical protein
VSAFTPTPLKETVVPIVPTFSPFVSKKKVRKWLEMVRIELGARQEPEWLDPFSVCVL